MLIVSSNKNVPQQIVERGYKKLTTAMKLVIISAVFLTLSGCASLVGDNRRDIKIESNPVGAAIYLDNQRYGVTPAIVTLPTYIYGGKTITLKKAGYHEQTMTVNSQFQPIALLDIFCWPTFIIDAATGNIVKIHPSNLNLHADLERIDSIRQD